MSLTPQFNVISSSEGGIYSGSIAKIQALNATTTFGSIQFGIQSSDLTAFVPTSTIETTVVVGANTVIEGPIGTVKVNTGGSLIYFNA
tara:strand:- start:11274 stop:11537 length:264 start_codon:yes stop_codon:yes gene_type:complete